MPTAPTSKPDDGRRDTLPQPPPRAGACPGPRHHEADNSRATKTGQLDELATARRSPADAGRPAVDPGVGSVAVMLRLERSVGGDADVRGLLRAQPGQLGADLLQMQGRRSDEHTYELKSLMGISYSVFCSKT